MTTNRCRGPDDVRLIARLVCSEFHVRPPAFEWRRPGSRTGRYLPHQRLGTILIAPDAPHWLLLHELAHHLHQHEMTERAVASLTRGGDDTGHGPNFRSCLMVAARVWYGDEARYPWYADYPALRRWWEHEQRTRFSVLEEN